MSALAGIFAFFILSGWPPPYQSDSVLLLQDGYKQSAIPTISGAGLLGGLEEKNNLRMLRQLIFSTETLRELDHQASLSRHFSEHGGLYERYLARQSDPARHRELLAHIMDVRIDDRAGLVMLTVRAHDPMVAQRIAVEVVSVAKRRVNELAQSAAVDQIRFLEGEAKRLQADDTAAQSRLSAFQSRSELTAAEIGTTSAPASVAAVDVLLMWQQRLSELQVRRAARTQLLHDNAPELKTLDAEINALRAQISLRKAELLNKPQSQGATPLGEARLSFAALLSEAQLSHELYLGSLRSIAQARSDASRTLKRVDLVEAPTLSTEKSRSNAMFDLFTAGLIGCMTWFLLGVLRQYVGTHID